MEFTPTKINAHSGRRLHVEKASRANTCSTILILTTLFELFVIVIGLFYIRKIALAIPSIPSLIYPEFKSHTTIEYVIHIITVFLFLETLKNLSTKIERIRAIDFFTNFLIKK